VQDGATGHRFLELPYTLVQDFTLFVLLGDKNIAVWKQKLDWIAGGGGMALLNSHPDYMSFSNTKTGTEEYPVRYYLEFLDYVNGHHSGRFFHALPSELFKDMDLQVVDGSGAFHHPALKSAQSR
jgi:hypothetical protein